MVFRSEDSGSSSKLPELLIKAQVAHKISHQGLGGKIRLTFYPMTAHYGPIEPFAN